MTQPELSFDAPDNTQCGRLLRYLETHGSITFIESWENLGILQPARRICELRKKGYSITTKMVAVKNRFGESCSVAKYIIKDC